MNTLSVGRSFFRSMGVVGRLQRNGVCMMLFLLPWLVMAQVEAARVELPPPFTRAQEKAVELRIVQDGADSETSILHALQTALGKDLPRQAAITLVTKDGVQPFALDHVDRVKPRRGVQYTVVRGDGQLKFVRPEQLNVFWSDSLVVIDSLVLDLAELRGAGPGQLYITVQSEEQKVMPTVRRGKKEPALHVLRNPCTTSGSGTSDTTCVRDIHLNSRTDLRLKGSARFIFLCANDRARLLAFAEAIGGVLGNDRDALIDKVEAFTKAYYGPPIRSDVERLLVDAGLIR